MGKTASSRAHIREETSMQEEDENPSLVSAAREALGGSAETNNEVTLISGKTYAPININAPHTQPVL